MTDLELGDLYASLLHEMKNNLVLVTVTLDRIERTGAPSHDQALEEARLLCRKASERLMQALLKVDLRDALALASLVVDLRITQIANGVNGVHAVLPHGAIRS